MHPTTSEHGRPAKPRVLLFSQRNLYRAHYRCSIYEFENIISNIDSVQLVAPQPNSWFKYGTRIANSLASKFPLELNPGLPKIKISENYELLFVICQFPRDLCNVRGLEGWHDHCETSVCWLNEVWLADLPKSKSWINSLKRFDYVVTSCSQSLEALTQSIGSKCYYLPHGIDTILFCPYPNCAKRTIDIYSIGRRSERTHHAILKLAREKNIFYVYDSMDGDQVISADEHRFLFANIAKRSKYFLVNPGKIDSPAETNQQIEFGTRYFEGAAAGAIMVGEKPDNEEFANYFDWSDVVINCPFGSEDIGKILNEVDNNPKKQEQMRQANVIQSLKRHDWLYRWEAVLRIAGLDPMPSLYERKQHLNDMAGRVEIPGDG
jgi:glycosyltransferase involved in cell wall biosynthesis